MDIQKQALDHQAKHGMEVLKMKNAHATRFFWLLAGSGAAFFGLAVVLILVRDDVSTGMLLLSHVGALVTGYLAGGGLEKIQENFGGRSKGAA